MQHPSPTEQLRYIEEIAVVPQPKGLHRLTTVLKSQGHSPVSPASRSGLHPLLIPLTQGPVSDLTGYSQLPMTAEAAGITQDPQDDVLVCLLRWHNPNEHKVPYLLLGCILLGCILLGCILLGCILFWSRDQYHQHHKHTTTPKQHPNTTTTQNMSMPVVTMARNARSMSLLARSVDEYINRTLAEEDHAAGQGGAEGPVTVALRSSGADADGPLYQPGDVHAAQLPSLAAFLTRKVGLFPDTVEQLVQAHLDRSDTMSMWEHIASSSSQYNPDAIGIVHVCISRTNTSNNNPRCHDHWRVVYATPAF